MFFHLSAGVHEVCLCISMPLIYNIQILVMMELAEYFMIFILHNCIHEEAVCLLVNYFSLPVAAM